MIGIYKIQSKCKPERFYIGSAVDIKRRWNNHNCDFKNNKHDNSKMQNHVNKYGIDDLEFSVIMECSKETLIAYEQFYIDSLNPWFNICKVAGSTLGIKATQKTIEILRIINTGRKHTEATKEKCRLSKIGNKVWQGKTHTEQWKKEAAERSKGNKNWVGRQHSVESKQKMRNVQKGHSATKKRMSLNVHNGIFYETGKEAFLSTEQNISYAFFIQMLSGKYNNKTRFIYV